MNGNGNVKAILQHRAERLSQIEKKPEDGTSLIEIVVFTLGEECYGIEPHYISEVRAIKALNILPSSPEFLAGIVNIRRKIVAVIDLKAIFGISSSDRAQKIVVLQSEKTEFALAVNEIKGVERVDMRHIQLPLPSFSLLKQKWLLGITQEQIIILDGKKLLNDEYLMINQVVS